MSALVTLDEDRASPAVEDFLSSANDFKTRHLIAKLTPERKRATIRKWIERGTKYHWYADDQLQLLLEAGFKKAERDELLDRIEEHARAFRWKREDKDGFLKKIRTVRSRNADATSIN